MTHRMPLPVLLLALLLLVFAAPTLAQDAPPADAPPISEALLAQLEEIEAFVLDLRGLALLEPLDRRFPSRVDAQEFIAQSVDGQLTAELLTRETAFYVAFDFIEPGLDLGALYISLLEDQVAGYYDTDAKTLNTILLTGGDLGDSLPLLEQIIYAHEFTHALQDQIFGLGQLLDDEELANTNPDALIARLSLMEGDATTVMNLYTTAAVERDPFSALSLLTQAEALGALPADIPTILTTELTFPYITGASFVTALVEAGGWAAVDAAFDNLPVSSEQIMNPEKYLAGELPIEVTLSEDTLSALGEGWSLVAQRVLGQFYLGEGLAVHTARATANRAASGWGGDQYAIFRDDTTDALAFVMRHAWDTPADRDEYEGAFARYATARLGLASDAAPTTADGVSCWEGEAEAACAGRIDDETIVAVAPTLADAEALVSAGR